MLGTYSAHAPNGERLLDDISGDHKQKNLQSLPARAGIDIGGVKGIISVAVTLTN